MKVLWFNWKDSTNPLAGGAEYVNESLAEKLVEDGHEVKFIVAGYKNAKKEEIINGYTIIRVGNRLTVYIRAWLYYMKNLKGWPDVVIEEINTIPFMTQWYVKEKKVLLIYQLCREIWFYEINRLVGIVGYLLEPIYLWLLRKNHVITESKSTKDDLKRYGFRADSISIFPVMIETRFLAQQTSSQAKNNDFTVLSLGSIRPMKRTLDQILAFEIAKKSIPELKLVIAGDNTGEYGLQTTSYIKDSPFSNDISQLGRVTPEEKMKLLQSSHLILGTSVKEGWGLTITEASALGTPAVVYDVDGLRDSVENEITGLTAYASPEELAKAIVRLYKDKTLYDYLQKNGVKKSSTFSLVRSYNEFVKTIMVLL